MKAIDYQTLSLFCEKGWGREVFLRRDIPLTDLDVCCGRAPSYAPPLSLPRAASDDAATGALRSAI